MQLRYAVLAASLFAGAAQAQDVAFKEWTLGASSAALEADGRFNCKNDPSALGDTICYLKKSVQLTIAGAAIERMMVSVYGGAIHGIHITLPHKRFDEVHRALTDKYGAGDTAQSVLQNRMGAKFDQAVTTWRVGKTAISAQRYGRKLDQATILYQTDFGLAEFERRRRGEAKTKADDL